MAIDMTGMRLSSVTHPTVVQMNWYSHDGIRVVLIHHTVKSATVFRGKGGGGRRTTCVNQTFWFLFVFCLSFFLCLLSGTDLFILFLLFFCQPFLPEPKVQVSYCHNALIAKREIFLYQKIESFIWKHNFLSLKMYLEVFYEISKCISDILEILFVGVFSDTKEIRIFDIRKSYFLDIKNYIYWY